MANIKRRDAYFSAVGEVSVYDNSFVIDKKWRSNEDVEWSVASLHMNCGDNLSVPIKVGGAVDGSINVVDMDDLVITQFANGKQEKITVPFAGRNDELYTSEISDNKFITVEIEKDESGNLIKKRFLLESDAVKYLKEKLENKAVVEVNGTIKFSKNKDVPEQIKKIRSIKLSEKTADKFYASCKIPFICTDTEVREVDKNGLLKVGGYVVDYFDKTAPIAGYPFDIYIDTTKITAYKEIMKSYFIGKNGLFNRINVGGYYVAGNNACNVDVNKYTAEIKDALKLGIVTEQEVSGKAIDGNKREIRFIFQKCYVNKTTNELEIEKDLDCTEVTPLYDSVGIETSAVVENTPQAKKVEQKTENVVKKKDVVESDNFDDLFNSDDLFG